MEIQLIQSWGAGSGLVHRLIFTWILQMSFIPLSAIHPISIPSIGWPVVPFSHHRNPPSCSSQMLFLIQLRHHGLLAKGFRCFPMAHFSADGSMKMWAPMVERIDAEPSELIMKSCSNLNTAVALATGVPAFRRGLQKWMASTWMPLKNFKHNSWATEFQSSS